MSHLAHEDFKALEHTRQRLYQLANNIASIKADIQQSSSMPSWSSLQASVSILASNIQALNAHLAKNFEAFSRTVVYPSTNYPGRTQEGLLGQLLRKKLEPQVETWVDEGRQTPAGGTDEDDLHTWARDWSGSRIAKYALEEAGDDYTVEERERGVDNVNTGLKMVHEDDEEIAESTDCGTAFGLGLVKKDLNTTARTIEEMLRFITTGTTPGQPKPNQ